MLGAVGNRPQHDALLNVTEPSAKCHFDPREKSFSTNASGPTQFFLILLRSRSRINFQLVSIRIEKVRLRSPEDPLIAIFDIKNFHAVLTQLIDRRLEFLPVYFERVMHRRALWRVVS